MAIDLSSKYGPAPAPPRNTATALPGAPGTVFGIPMPTGGQLFQNAPVGGPAYTAAPHPAQYGPPPVHAPAPAAPGAPPAQAAAPPQASPLDSTYYMDVAGNDFRINNQIAGLQQQQAYGTDDLQRALIQLAHSQALNERTDRERANSSGLLSSTTLANTLGELTRSGGDRQAALQSQSARRNAALDSQIAALRGSQQLYDQGQYLAAAQRQAAADAANRALGEQLPAAPGGAGSAPGGPGAGSGLPGTPGAPIQIYRPRTDSTGQHLLPPVPGQPPLVRPARLPPPPPRRRDLSAKRAY